MSLLLRFRSGLLGLSLLGVTWSAPALANTWEQISRYSSVLRESGTATLVARDCPEALLGAFHAGRNAVLLCANNLSDDPALAWTVLAHESAHAMQKCNGNPLLADHQLDQAMNFLQETSPVALQELRLYHQSQKREEIEARLVQGLPAAEVESLYRQFCHKRPFQR